MHTIWKDIPDYPYQVSNTGLVRTQDGGILKQQLYNNYLSVYLYSATDSKWFKVHRLVAEAFIPNPDDLPVVNHEDFNTFNNHAYNLKWMTHQDNVNHSKDRMIFNSYIVQQLHPDTLSLIATFDSCKDAVEAMGGKNNGSAVAKAIKQNSKSFGYYWKRATTS
jgi:hypothetical protein